MLIKFFFNKKYMKLIRKTKAVDDFKTQYQNILTEIVNAFESNDKSPKLLLSIENLKKLASNFIKNN